MTYEQRPGPQSWSMLVRTVHSVGDSPSGDFADLRAIGPGIGLASTRDVLTCAWHTDARIEGCTDRTVYGASSPTTCASCRSPQRAPRSRRPRLGRDGAGMPRRVKARASESQKISPHMHYGGGTMVEAIARPMTRQHSFYFNRPQILLSYELIFHQHQLEARIQPGRRLRAARCLLSCCLLARAESGGLNRLIGGRSRRACRCTA
jgi:hypothetical protein